MNSTTLTAFVKVACASCYALTCPEMAIVPRVGFYKEAVSRGTGTIA
jgi:hypothetical protein